MKEQYKVFTGETVVFVDKKQYNELVSATDAKKKEIFAKIEKEKKQPTK